MRKKPKISGCPNGRWLHTSEATTASAPAPPTAKQVAVKRRLAVLNNLLRGGTTDVVPPTFIGTPSVRTEHIEPGADAAGALGCRAMGDANLQVEGHIEP